MKFLLIPLFILSINLTVAQTINFNKYQYVIVDSKFDFVRQVDGYRTSSLTKFLFKKKGFITYLDNEEYTDELAKNGCKALYAEVKDVSGFFVTKSYIEIRDCKDRLLFKSSEGTSKYKEYEKAYRQSIRRAFESISEIPYEYDLSLSKNEEEVKKETIKEEVNISPKVQENSKTLTPTKKLTGLLYAQVSENGFQLVDSKPAVVFFLLRTNNPHQFIIKDKNGVFTKIEGDWLAEYYDNGKLVSKRYQVKF